MIHLSLFPYVNHWEIRNIVIEWWLLLSHISLWSFHWLHETPFNLSFIPFFRIFNRKNVEKFPLTCISLLWKIRTIVNKWRLQNLQVSSLTFYSSIYYTFNSFFPPSDESKISKTPFIISILSKYTYIKNQKIVIELQLHFSHFSLWSFHSLNETPYNLSFIPFFLILIRISLETEENLWQFPNLRIVRNQKNSERMRAAIITLFIIIIISFVERNSL